MWWGLGGSVVDGGVLVVRLVVVVCVLSVLFVLVCRFMV